MKKTLFLLAFTVIVCMATIISAGAVSVTDSYVAWDFANPNDTAEWTPTGTTTIEQLTDGIKFSGSGNDLNMSYYPTSGAFSIENYTYVVLEYSDATLTGTFQFYRWLSGTHYYISAQTSPKDTRHYTLTYDASAESNWSGTPTQLRLDPTRANDERSIVIHTFGLYKDEAAYQQYLTDIAVSRFAVEAEATYGSSIPTRAQLEELAEAFNDVYEETFGYAAAVSVTGDVTSTAKVDGTKANARGTNGGYSFTATATNADGTYTYEGTAAVVTDKAEIANIVWDFSNPTDAYEWSKTAQSDTFTVNDNGLYYGSNATNAKANNTNMSYAVAANQFYLSDYDYVVLKYRNATYAGTSGIQFYRFVSTGPKYMWGSKLNTIDAVGSAVQLKTADTSTMTDWGEETPTSLRLDPFRDATENARYVELISFGLYKDEAAYDEESAKMAIDRIDRMNIKAANADEAKAAVEAMVQSLMTDYDPNVTVEADTTNAVYTAAVNGTTADPCGKNGSYTLSVTASQGDAVVTKEVSVTISPVLKNIILNFDNPVMVKNAAAYATIETSLVANSEGEAGNYALLGDNLMKLVKMPNTKKLDATEFYFSLTAGQNGIPAISDLSKFPVVVYSYKVSAGGTYQIYYYTDGYTKANAYQQFFDAVDEGYEVGSWGIKTLTVNPAGNKTAGYSATEDYSWANALKSIRFDFMKVSYTYPTQDPATDWDGVNGIEEGSTVYLDYIGLFPDAEAAASFTANPTLDAATTVEELKTKYADVLEAAEQIDYNLANDEEADGIATDAEAIQIIKNYMTEQGIDESRYYVVIHDNTPAVPSLEAPVCAAHITYEIICADSITNGNYVSSGELTLVGENTLCAFDFETLGVQYRADGTPGLRFGVQVNYNEFVEEPLKITGAENVTYGVLVTLEELYNASIWPLDHATIVATGVDGVYKFPDGGEVADVEAKYVFSSDDECFVYTAVVTGIPAGVEKNFYFLPYVKYDYNGNTYYYYSDYAYVAPANYSSTDWNQDY